MLPPALHILSWYDLTTWYLSFPNHFVPNVFYTSFQLPDLCFCLASMDRSQPYAATQPASFMRLNLKQLLAKTPPQATFSSFWQVSCACVRGLPQCRCIRPGNGRYLALLSALVSQMRCSKRIRA